MNKLYTLILVIAICRICNAQNLVPNYSFESISGCPSMENQLFLASPWSMPSNMGSASSDLYNVCGTGYVGIPSNVAGYQGPHTGAGYAAFYTYGYDCREYVMVQLISPLIAGNVYLVEMYVNPGNEPGIGVDAIGAYISTGPVSGNGTYDPLPFVPQVSNPVNNIITDTAGWTLISGLYTAAGGEDYITIGNFLDDISTNNFTYYSSGWNRGYYYVDDVSVSDVTSAAELKAQEMIHISPNPFKDHVSITTGNNEVWEMMLYDITSRKLFEQRFKNSVTLNTGQLAKGIYMYELRNNPGSPMTVGKEMVVKKGKIVKE